jgi:hypothetical protein
MPLGQQMGELLGGHPEGDHEGESNSSSSGVATRCGSPGSRPLIWTTRWASDRGAGGPGSDIESAHSDLNQPSCHESDLIAFSADASSGELPLLGICL